VVLPRGALFLRIVVVLGVLQSLPLARRLLRVLDVLKLLVRMKLVAVVRLLPGDVATPVNTTLIKLFFCIF
jgi:hypothetical protein